MSVHADLFPVADALNNLHKYRRYTLHSSCEKEVMLISSVLTACGRQYEIIEATGAITIQLVN